MDGGSHLAPPALVRYTSLTRVNYSHVAGEKARRNIGKMSAIAPVAAVDTASSRLPVRIATAIKPFERDLFSIHWRGDCATDTLVLTENGEDFELDDLIWKNPEVLLACWSTPRLPKVWLESPDCALRYVCYLAGSVRRTVPRSFIEKGGLVTNWGGMAAPQVAEHTLLLTLSILRRQSEWRSFIQQPPNKRHLTPLQTRTLYGCRVGLHGFGAVARSLVALLQPFQVNISAFSEGVPPDHMREYGVTPSSSLAELFSGSDVVFECEALTARSAGSVSAAILAELPDGGVFVNVGRGPLVDEAALLAEVKSGRLFAALDVSTNEPFTPDMEFFTTDNILISPHIAGPTNDRLTACGEFARENVARYLRKEPLHAQVTLEIYDRST